MLPDLWLQQMEVPKEDYGLSAGNMSQSNDINLKFLRDAI
jgi:hypothetical protein